MQVRTKYLVSIVLAVALLGATWFAYREYEERRRIREEDVLKNLELGEIGFKDATPREILDGIVKRANALGHPELRLHFFTDPRDVPDFHTESNWRPSSAIPEKFTIRFGDEGRSTRLGDVLQYIGAGPDSTWWLRGHDLIAVHARGTVEPFQRAVFRLNPGFFVMYSDRPLDTFAKDNGLTFYEGMTVEFRREQSTVEIYGPRNQVDLLELIIDPLPSRWEEVKANVEGWRSRLFGF